MEVIPFTYLKGWLSATEADALLASLEARSDWTQGWIRMFGREVPEPRLTFFEGDPGVRYTYAHRPLEGRGWSPELEALRERISAWYGSRFGVQVPARRIVVTAGASGALLLACMALIEDGDEVLMPDPSYPCNRHFVSASQGRAVLLATDAAQRFQLSASQVKAHWGAKTRGVLLASPSNPTGTSVAATELKAIHSVVQQHDGITMVDEIYLGLSYDDAFAQTALAIDDQIISINSFSKYFNMTGWRLGWMVAPLDAAKAAANLQSHLSSNVSNISQRAALTALTGDQQPVKDMLAAFDRRRQLAVSEMNKVPGVVTPTPKGAFYIYSDVSGLLGKNWGGKQINSSLELCDYALDAAEVAMVPGEAFGPTGYVRLSYALGDDQLVAGIQRLQRLFS